MLANRVLSRLTVAALWGALLASAGMSRDAAAADEIGPFGPSVLSCFYECKAIGPTILQETTTLLIANERPEFDATGSPIPASRAHLIFLDGNENPRFRTFVDLSGNDLDEINVCHTLKAQVGLPAAPSAGIVKIVVEDGTTVSNPNSFEASTGVVAWIKNVFGQFFVPPQPLPFSDPNPFGSFGIVRSIAKTGCQAADPAVEVADSSLVDPVPLAQFQPPFATSLVLIEGTAD